MLGTHNRGRVVDATAIIYHTHNRLDQRALTSTIRANNSDKVVGKDIEIDVHKCHGAVVAHTKVSY